MQTLITWLQVIALLALAVSVAIGLIAGICWVGGRQADEQLSPDSPLNYGTRHGDHPMHRCARRREDHVRAQFEAGCG